MLVGDPGGYGLALNRGNCVRCSPTILATMPYHQSQVTFTVAFMILITLDNFVLCRDHKAVTLERALEALWTFPLRTRSRFRRA